MSALPVIACCRPLAAPALSDEEAGAAAGLFKALADPARVKILNLLATSDEPVCVCELIAPLGLTQPTVSHHLKKLTDAGLLVREQRGVWAFYAIDPPAVDRLRAVADLEEDDVNDQLQLREEVRQHYAAAATRNGGCCGFDSTTGVMSLGSGDPLAVAELHPGERVLDLGSGAGPDVIRAAEQVGGDGLVWGLDMTDEMLALARRNATNAGVANAHFLRGEIEAVPLSDESVDVAISNCVINLSTDKPAVFGELARVLVPGGRVAVSDIVAEDRLSPAERGERGSYCGCIAGALSRGEYERLLGDAGFENVSVELGEELNDGMHAATVRATKPA